MLVVGAERDYVREKVMGWGWRVAEVWLVIVRRRDGCDGEILTGRRCGGTWWKK
jgi:hypothetical protein